VAGLAFFGLARLQDRKDLTHDDRSRRHCIVVENKGVDRIAITGDRVRDEAETEWKVKPMGRALWTRKTLAFSSYVSFTDVPLEVSTTTLTIVVRRKREPYAAIHDFAELFAAVDAKIP
jgi:hypothetical protein